jgi:hypothetical protein
VKELPVCISPQNSSRNNLVMDPALRIRPSSYQSSRDREEWESTECPGKNLPLSGSGCKVVIFSMLAFLPVLDTRPQKKE